MSENISAAKAARSESAPKPLSIISKTGVAGQMLSIPETEYRALDAISQSNLKEILRSPSHYKARLSAPHDPTPAMILGTAIHTMILEPDLVEKSIVVAPKFGRSKGDLEAKELFHVEHSGKLILTQDQFDQASGAASAVYKNKLAKQILSCGRNEQSFVWTDPETGVKCKSRPDVVRDGHILVDVKSTADASLAAFQKSIANFKYHFQAAWYLDGVGRVTGEKYDQFVFIVVETKAPHGVAIYAINEPTINAGHALTRHALKKLKECQDANKWPGYIEEIQPIDLPPWAYPLDSDYE